MAGPSAGTTCLSSEPPSRLESRKYSGRQPFSITLCDRFLPRRRAGLAVDFRIPLWSLLQGIKTVHIKNPVDR